MKCQRFPCEPFPSVSNPGGNDSMDFTKIKSASILTLAIELLSEISIIKLPKSAKYSPIAS